MTDTEKFTKDKKNEYLLSRKLPDAPRDGLVVAFPFDLCRNSAEKATERCDGICVLYSDRLCVYENAVLTNTFALSEYSDFRVNQGVGCITVECTSPESGDMLICRSGASHSSFIGTVMKQIGRMKEGGAFSYEALGSLSNTCPKCKRPLPSGSKACPRCADKKGIIRRLWGIAKPYRFYIYISVIMFFVISGVNLLVPRINRILVDQYINTKDPQNVELYGFCAVILSLAGVNVLIKALSFVRNRVTVIASSRVIVRLREIVFDKIQMMSVARISKRTAGELMSRVGGDTSQIQQFITDFFPNAIQQILILVTISVILFVYDYRLALLILTPAPIVSVAFRVFWNRIHPRYRRQWQSESEASSTLHDIFSGIRVVKAFGMEEKEAERYDRAAEKLRDISVKNEVTWAIIMPWLNLFMGIGEFFLLYYVGNRILDGTMTFGEMAQFSAYVGMIYGPLRWISSIPRNIMRFMTSCTKVFEIIDEEIDVPDMENAVSMDIRGTVDFENVTFSYDGTTDVLKNVNLHIEPGEMIGIVGRSGVGKSTLLNLLMRMYDTCEGSIKVDGIDLRELSQESLRSQIGVVLQETLLFSGTVYDNIAYAKPSASRDEIISASRLAGAHEFIMRLPDAYNTRVGEKGYTLSGGERQRLSIARALLHNPRILLLDEATSSLDTETERKIQESIQKLIKDRTTIAIAHRLSTLRNATRLVVLDKGTVAEVGTHEELMRKKGIYYGLVMAQRQMSKTAKSE